MNLQPKAVTNSFPILFVLLAALGCKYFSPPQKLESETVSENPNRTIPDLPVFLNGEPLGTIADINKGKTTDVGEIAQNRRTVREALAEITKRRENDGVRLEGTNVVPTNVHLIANPELAIGALAELHIVINENAGDVYIPKRNPATIPTEVSKPDPLTLEVRTELPTSGTEPNHRSTYDPEYKYSYNTSFEFVKTAESLLSYRAWFSSVELSADERYFINQAQGPEADEGPKYTKVKQRAIEAASLESELGSIVEPVNNEILIIASENASYASLLKILAAGESLNVKFQVIVRPRQFDGVQK